MKSGFDFLNLNIVPVVSSTFDRIKLNNWGQPANFNQIRIFWSKKSMIDVAWDLTTELIFEYD